MRLQTRRFLTQLDQWVTEQCVYHRIERTAFRFLARDLRAVTGLSATQVKLHLHRLVDLEYVLLHRATRGIGVAYELVYDGQGQNGTPFLTGLINVERLTAPGTTADRSGSGGHRPEQNTHRSESGRPSVGTRSGGGRSRRNRSSSAADSNLPADRSDFSEITAADGAAVAS